MKDYIKIFQLPDGHIEDKESLHLPEITITASKDYKNQTESEYAPDYMTSVSIDNSKTDSGIRIGDYNLSIEQIFLNTPLGKNPT